MRSKGEPEPCGGSLFSGEAGTARAQRDADGVERLRDCAWIVGHSVHQAKRRAAKRPYGENLNLNTDRWRVQWFGKGGMGWEDLLPFLQAKVGIMGPPSILIIHLGGNDIGKLSCRKLIGIMRKDLARIMSLWPEMKVGWSEIIIRIKHRTERVWKNGVKKLNRQIGKWVVQQGGFWIRHEWSWGMLEGFFLGDGVHLSDVGMDLYNNALEEGLEQQV
ncbi:uncharacterized protein LOC115081909 [Rhinatrema bivittatum]|uniref:uncharacterized protein LOC115081909 n=1 Tax=Rhinatrema bivittatum TaxID=194408 RepID=UPI00112D71F1|nr:uncharacterized protein LOC115081909 [Rhinatrema bivittatum]